MSANHPLPTPPGQQGHQGRPRAKSSFSFHSRKSSGSGSGSGQKVDLHETHEEKQSHRLQSKADPSMAIQEMEPGEFLFLPLLILMNPMLFTETD